MIGWIICVIFLVVRWGQNRVKHSTPTACFAEKIKLYVVYEIWSKYIVFTSEYSILNKKNIGEGLHTVTVLVKQF